MATDFLVKQGRVMGGVRLVTDADVAHQTDLTNIRETGTTSSQAISASTYFYLNGTLVKAKTAIANGATFTLNTNYEVVTAGGLNDLKGATTANTKVSLGSISTYTPTKNGVIKVATNNSTAGSFVYIADHASGMVLAVCNGYNANTGCFCSCPVYANKQYDFFTNPNSSVIGVEFLAIE